MEMNEIERDPEELWKKDRSYWKRMEVEGHETQEEEAHSSYSFFKHVKIQFILAIVLFAAVFGLNYLEHPTVSEAKGWLKTELGRSFDFIAIAAWYEHTFEGSPSFIPSFGSKSELAIAEHSSISTETAAPVAGGVLLHSFAELLNGVEIAGTTKAEVRAVDKGRVILVTDKQDSVIIQHANERVSIYSRLSDVNVKVSDWVETGKVIGKLAPIAGEDYSVLFLAMKQKDLYIDPLDVISLE